MDFISISAYTRIGFVAASWLFVADYPVYFLMLFLIADTIGTVDKLFLKSSHGSEKQNTEL